MENSAQPTVNELIKRTYEELEELTAKGFETFAYSFDVNSDSKIIKDSFIEGTEMNVRIAGRIMAIRRMGKASFAHIQDHSGRIQVYLKKDEIAESYDAFKLMDIGDIIGVEGFVFITKTGEISVHTRELKLLSKSIPVVTNSRTSKSERPSFALALSTPAAAASFMALSPRPPTS